MQASLSDRSLACCCGTHSRYVLPYLHHHTAHGRAAVYKPAHMRWTVTVCLLYQLPLANATGFKQATAAHCTVAVRPAHNSCWSSPEAHWLVNVDLQEHIQNVSYLFRRYKEPRQNNAASRQRHAPGSRLRPSPLALRGRRAWGHACWRRRSQGDPSRHHSARSQNRLSCHLYKQLPLPQRLPLLLNSQSYMTFKCSCLQMHVAPVQLWYIGPRSSAHLCHERCHGCCVLVYSYVTYVQTACTVCARAHSCLWSSLATALAAQLPSVTENASRRRDRGFPLELWVFAWLLHTVMCMHGMVAAHWLSVGGNAMLLCTSCGPMNSGLSYALCGSSPMYDTNGLRCTHKIAFMQCCWGWRCCQMIAIARGSYGKAHACMLRMVLQAHASCTMSALHMHSLKVLTEQLKLALRDLKPVL